MGIVNFSDTPAHKICALGRALYGLYPLTCFWNSIPVKLYDICLSPLTLEDSLDEKNVIDRPGFAFYNKNTNDIYVRCVDGMYLAFKRIGILGKKPMKAKDFNNGYLRKEILNKRLFT